MNSQLLLWINVGLGVLFAAWFLLGRKKKGPGPTSLDMKKGSSQNPSSLEFYQKARELRSQKEEFNSEPKPAADFEQNSTKANFKRQESAAQTKSYTGDAGKYSKYSAEVLKKLDAVDENMKQLNIMFNFNGHAWDAYEVLGIPAGSSIEAVTVAYQSAVREAKTENLEFLETAYKAILAKI